MIMFIKVSKLALWPHVFLGLYLSTLQFGSQLGSVNDLINDARLFMKDIYKISYLRTFSCLKCRAIF